MKRLVNDLKALRTVRKTPMILAHLLHGITQQQAATRRDGPDGWSILEIICHLRDIEEIFTGRVRDLLAGPNPTFTVITNETLMACTDYAAQDLRLPFEDYRQRRQALIALVEPLNDEQWLLAGVHPGQGPATLLEVVNTGLHDVDHIEQIIRCLGSES